MSETLKAPPIPCGSCPYRTDVPPGIWEQHEYDKLPRYDGPTWAQVPAVFMCHQNDGCLCGGWLACHGPQELLALRLPRDIDPSVFDYATSVPVFTSGAAARAHGISGIVRPNPRARKMIDGLMRKRSRKRKALRPDDRTPASTSAVSPEPNLNPAHVQHLNDQS